MTTQTHQAQPTQSPEEQAEKLRRVLSVKAPVLAQDKPVATTPKSSAR